MSEGPGAGEILAGIFVILCGLCLTLLGGGCTFIWIVFIFRDAQTDGILLFLFSLATLAAGLLLLWAGVKMLSGKMRS